MTRKDFQEYITECLVEVPTTASELIKQQCLEMYELDMLVFLENFASKEWGVILYENKINKYNDVYLKF